MHKIKQGMTLRLKYSDRSKITTEPPDPILHDLTGHLYIQGNHDQNTGSIFFLLIN